ncbi:MAG: polysaccharide deacetylase family protein [Thermoanaerobaculia bacterium]
MRATILVFAALAPFVAIGIWPVSWLLALGVLFLSHMLILYPTLRARAQWLGPVFTRFETSSPEVWLTIDDGPTPDTAEILDVLRRHATKATFFVKGALAEDDPAMTRRIHEAGHEIANHSHTHPSATFWCLPPAAIQREIEGCNRVIESITGTRPDRFRAPVGMKNPFVHPILQRLGMPLVAWTSRGFDGVDGFSPETVADRILADASPGAIILMHQGVKGNDGAFASARCLDLVLSGLANRGLAPVIPSTDHLVTGSGR